MISAGESEGEPTFPSCAGCYQRDPLLSHLIKKYEVCRQLGLESLGEPQILDPTDPTKYVADSINKYAQEPLGRHHLESPTGNPSAPFNSHSFPNSMAGFLCALSSGSKGQPLQTATELMQNADPTL